MNYEHALVVQVTSGAREPPSFDGNYMPIVGESRLVCGAFFDEIEHTSLSQSSNPDMPEIIFHNSKLSSVFPKKNLTAETYSVQTYEGTTGGIN
jgi:hypothetical protein